MPDLQSFQRLGFIGGGNMTSAICQGIISKDIFKPSDIWVSGPHLENLIKLRGLGINITCSNGEVVKQCDVIFLAVKPFNLNLAIEDCKNTLELPIDLPNKLFISILAGTSLAVLRKTLSVFESCRIIRVMPNTPMLLGAGACVYSPEELASEKDCMLVEKILGTCGIFEKVPESMINAMGALSGSGPAFVYTMIEALSDGGVKQGIPRAMSTKFAAQTVLGAARMILETGKHTGNLKDDVCSAGGSTICGIHALEKGGMRGSFMDAIEAAVKRSIEMGKEAEQK